MKEEEAHYAFNICTVHNAIVFIKIVVRQVRGKGVNVWYVPKDMDDDCLLSGEATELPATWRMNAVYADE